jgi:predicted nucleotidyltransferase
MSLTEQLKKPLAALPAVRLAVLFGSAARGEERPGSDVDVGLRLDPDSAALRQEIKAALGCSVKVIWLDEAPPRARFDIASEGVVIIERHEYEWAEFRARAAIDWWDWDSTLRWVEEFYNRVGEEPAGKPHFER